MNFNEHSPIPGMHQQAHQMNLAKATEVSQEQIAWAMEHINANRKEYRKNIEGKMTEGFGQFAIFTNNLNNLGAIIKCGKVPNALFTCLDRSVILGWMHDNPTEGMALGVSGISIFRLKDKSFESFDVVSAYLKVQTFVGAALFYDGGWPIEDFKREFSRVRVSESQFFDLAEYIGTTKFKKSMEQVDAETKDNDEDAVDWSKEESLTDKVYQQYKKQLQK